jgi:DNA-binding CsgD family transcriptional regulator
LGRLHNDVGEWATARSFLEESLRLERQSNNEYGAALTGSLLGILALLRGEYASARVHLEESLETLRRLGGLDEVKRCLLFLGFLACNQGDYATARARLAQLMEGNPLRRYRWPAPFIVLAYAHLAAGEGQAVRALRLAGAATKLTQTIGTSIGPTYWAYLQRGVEPAWQALGEEEGAAAWEEGRSMTLAETVTYALEEPALQEEEDAYPPDTRTASVGADETRSEPYLEGLTTRETEVLGLLASGKTNKQIASQLVLSVSTVQRHVANVYAKIGARGRAEATAYALSRDITRPRSGRRPSP